VYRVRTSITGGQGGPYLSTLYFNVVGGLTAANANAAVGAFWLAVKGRVATGITMSTEAEVATIDIATGQVTGITAVTPVVNVGTAAGDTCPPATQGLLRWRTGTYIGGREIRGRTFLPGVTETDNVNGVPSASYISTVNAAAAAMIADANSDFMVYSRKNFDAAPGLSGSVWSQWAVLRSRRD